MVIPFLPLTALTILIVAAVWARRLRPSLSERLFALIPVELVVLVSVLFVVGGFNVDTYFLWILANIVFAPWWLLGSWFARFTDGTQRADPPTAR